MDDLVKIFNGKRVLVTGDTGFKGSWLSLWLHELGAKVLGYALPPERENDHFNLIKLNKIIKHINGDIRNFNRLKKACDSFKPEFIFHLAAQALVSVSYAEAKRTFDTNIGGSVNILEIARLSGYLRTLVYITSDKCYKNKELTRGYCESDELGGRDPYSASKASAEMVFAAYNNSFFTEKKSFGAASTRAGNVIGGGDWSSDRIVPDCIKALQDNKPIVLRRPEATRPWQHVLEPLSGYLTLATMLYNNPRKYSDSWNFGPSGKDIKTVKDVAEKIVFYWGKGKIRIQRPKNYFYESTLLHLNCSKAAKILRWSAKWGFERSIKETALWYKSVFEGNPALAMTRKQIQMYMAAKNDRRR
ncbi:MAG: CDP-glucose 4,6-dehydratase [Planctomycetes bacterium]|nr:CDP-glucose 4,6-dehydratase [Planctomycetota bacterium]